MLKGVRCNYLAPGSESLVETPNCLACASTGRNPCGYPLPMLRLMTRDRDPVVVSCSATMLSGCPREQGIKKQFDWYVDPDRAFTRAFGSAVHIAMEHLHQPGTEAVVETRYAREYTLPDGRTTRITAQLDALYFEDEHHAVIDDYKVVATLAPSKIRRKVASYVPQLSIQRWILTAYDVEVTSAQLTFMATEGRRVYDLLDPEVGDDPRLLSLEETQGYLDAHAPALLSSLNGDLSKPLSDPSEFWRCSWCDVRNRCEELHGRALPAFQ